MLQGLGGLGNMAQLLKQASQFKQKMADMQAELAKEEVTASSGGGMVTVTMTGAQDVKSVKIDPAVMNPDDIEMLEDLIAAAVNEARNRAQELGQERMGGMFAGLGIDPSMLQGLGG